MKKIREALTAAYKLRDELNEKLDKLDPGLHQEYRELEIEEISNDGYIRGLEFALIEYEGGHQ